MTHSSQVFFLSPLPSISFLQPPQFFFFFFFRLSWWPPQSVLCPTKLSVAVSHTSTFTLRGKKQSRAEEEDYGYCAMDIWLACTHFCSSWRDAVTHCVFILYVCAGCRALSRRDGKLHLTASSVPKNIFTLYHLISFFSLLFSPAPLQQYMYFLSLLPVASPYPLCSNDRLPLLAPVTTPATLEASDSVKLSGISLQCQGYFRRSSFLFKMWMIKGPIKYLKNTWVLSNGSQILKSTWHAIKKRKGDNSRRMTKQIRSTPFPGFLPQLPLGSFFLPVAQGGGDERETGYIYHYSAPCMHNLLEKDRPQWHTQIIHGNRRLPSTEQEYHSSILWYTDTLIWKCEIGAPLKNLPKKNPVFLLLSLHVSAV